jgi:peroxiredoxin
MPDSTAAAAPPIPDVGDIAPDFTLKSTSGEMVTLSALRGKPVLVAFFPLAFSEVCTEQFCEMRDEWAAFASRDAVILPISVDHAYSLAAYKKHHDYPTDFLSDFKREVTRSYGVLREDRQHARRSYFLIDGSGVIRWRHLEEPGQRRANSELLAAIDAVGA